MFFVSGSAALIYQLIWQRVLFSISAAGLLLGALGLAGSVQLAAFLNLFLALAVGIGSRLPEEAS